MGRNKGAHYLYIKHYSDLRSSGVRWHKSSDDLRDMGFFPYKAEYNIWMRQYNGLWKYIVVYIDDLAFLYVNQIL